MTVVSINSKPQWSFLDTYTLDAVDLVDRIAFALGTLALHRAGYTRLRALYHASREELLAVRGIGKRKAELIGHFFRENNYIYPAPIRRNNESASVIILRPKPESEPQPS